jgi:8-oxo-dGTP diphosphatase
MKSSDLTLRYPALFKLGTRGTIDEFKATTIVPDESLIGNTYMIAESNGKLLYIIQEDGNFQIPGGKKDPGENHIETIKREMIEEAGAEIESFSQIGLWHLILKSEKPFHPHLPHPELFMVVGFGKVKITQRPSNPDGSKATRDVCLDTIENVTEIFRKQNRNDLADLFQFAWDMKKSDL